MASGVDMGDSTVKGEMLRAAKERFAARARERRKRARVPDPAPRYDDVFEKGTQALDVAARS